MFRFRLLAIALVAALAAAACGSGDTGDGTGTAADPGPTTPLPQPSGEVVLTVRGSDRPNVGDEVVVDLAGIESLGTTTVTLHEPFVNAELEMTGVPVDQFLAAAGVDPDVDLVWTALDDYQVHFNRRAVAAEDALLATRIDGAPIEIADGGPIRVVFTDPAGLLGRDTNQWIWSLHLIEVG